MIYARLIKSAPHHHKGGCFTDSITEQCYIRKWHCARNLACGTSLTSSLCNDCAQMHSCFTPALSISAEYLPEASAFADDDLHSDSRRSAKCAWPALATHHPSPRAHSHLPRHCLIMAWRRDALVIVHGVIASTQIEIGTEFGWLKSMEESKGDRLFSQTFRKVET